MTAVNNPRAAYFRLQALALSWRSSAFSKCYDAEMAECESEKVACRREAQTFEVCACHIEAAVRELKSALGGES